MHSTSTLLCHRQEKHSIAADAMLHGLSITGARLKSRVQLAFHAALAIRTASTTTPTSRFAGARYKQRPLLDLLLHIACHDAEVQICKRCVAGSTSTAACRARPTMQSISKRKASTTGPAVRHLGTSPVQHILHRKRKLLAQLHSLFRGLPV